MGNKKLPAEVRRILAFALKRARLERCGVDEEHQKALKLYLDTWVAEPIQTVLRYDDGELSAIDLRGRYRA